MLIVTLFLRHAVAWAAEICRKKRLVRVIRLLSAAFILVSVTNRHAAAYKVKGGLPHCKR